MVTVIGDTDVAWLAGLIDGEGCISLYKRTVRGRPYGWDYFFTISNADEAIVLEAARVIRFLSEFDPYIRYDKPRGNRRPCYSVVLSRRSQIQDVLNAVIPYLRGNKREQGQLLLQALHTSNRDRRHQLARAIKALKSSYGDAEVTLGGLRSPAHRNDYVVSTNDNPRTSVRLSADDQADLFSER